MRSSRIVNQRRLVRYSLLGVNVVLVAGVVWFILRNPNTTLPSQTISSTSADTSATASDPLDQLTSADIAETVAQLDNLPEETAITNQADSENAELSIMQASTNLVAKPQVVSTAYLSNKDIKTYIAESGDTVASVAAKFGLTANTIKWSNDLSGNTLTPGQKLYIPPVNGIVYIVKQGDTPSSLASKFNASAAQIIDYNDAELSGLTPGELIIIPNGQQQSASVAADYSTDNDTATWGIGAVYGDNGYDFGYCTWWVAERRAQVGEPLPSNLGNAATWGYLAAQMGLPVGNTPQKYAAVVLSTVGEGHVGFVESVNANNSITISEMNVYGWDVEDTRTIPASQVDDYTYIY